MRYKTRKDFLKEIEEDYIRQITNLEVEIEILNSVIPSTIVGKKQLSENATEELTAEQAIEIKSKILDNWIQKLNAVNNLLEKL